MKSTYKFYGKVRLRSSFYCCFPISLLVLVLAYGSANGFSLPEKEEVPEALRQICSETREPKRFWVGCEPIYAGEDLIEFYRKRNYRPVWIVGNQPSEAAKGLLSYVGDAESHGLALQDYHYTCISEWLRSFTMEPDKTIEAKELAGLEIVLSDSFLNLANHLYAGKVDPKTIYPHWISANEMPQIFALLDNVKTTEDVHHSFQQLMPKNPRYQATA
jgi:murein L,D-transpeptidase YcbB/YkuD